VYSTTRSQVVELLLSLLLRLRGHVRVVHGSLEASSNIAKVLSLLVGFQIVKLLLGLSLAFDGVVRVVDGTEFELSIHAHNRTSQKAGHTP
jgi:hypothetical protein